MSMPKDLAELALVRLAITCGTRGCCEWQERAERIFRSEVALVELTADAVRADLIEYVKAGGEVVQNEENREEWRDSHAFWYKVIIPIPGMKHGLFVEIILVNRDPDLPEVRIVRAKPSDR